MMMQRIKTWMFQTNWWQWLGKNRREVDYWRQNARKMVAWHRGEAEFRLPFPTAEEKETRYDEFKNALMTYIAAETRHGSYLTDLALRADSFTNMRVMDIGSGPMPTLNVFDQCERICVDHLIDTYMELGYPLDEFELTTTFVNAKSEQLPFADDSIDVVLSRNALDHVDDFEATCAEILRVLAPGGWLHVQLHYHAPTSTEPHVLSDERVQACLTAPGLRKIREDHGAWGFENGATVVWSNVPDHALVKGASASADSAKLLATT